MTTDKHDMKMEGPACDQCGCTRAYVEFLASENGTTDAYCCDMTEVFSQTEGYRQ